MVTKFVDSFIKAICRIIDGGSQLLLDLFLLVDHGKAIPVKLQADLMWYPESIF